MKLFAKHLETIIGGSTATLNLNGNKLLVELYDEIYLVVLLTPEVELIVVFISLIQQMCPHRTLYPMSPKLRRGKCLLECHTTLNREERCVVNHQFWHRIVFACIV